MAAKRLTRKEMVQKDRIQQTLTETSSWLVRNLRYILAIAAIAIVAVAATYLWQSYQQSLQAGLQTKFTDALAKYHASVTEEDDGGLPEPSGAEANRKAMTKYEFATAQERSEKALSAFQELSEEYPEMILGALSKYYVGLVLVDLKKPDEAKTVLTSLIADSEFSDITNLARNVLVQVAVSGGDEKEAIRLLNEILDEPSRNFPLQMVLTRLGQNYEAVGDYEAALRSYRKVSAEYGGSPFAIKSQARIDYLELRGVTIEEEEEEEEPEKEVQPPATPQ